MYIIDGCSYDGNPRRRDFELHPTNALVEVKLLTSLREAERATAGAFPIEKVLHRHQQLFYYTLTLQFLSVIFDTASLMQSTVSVTLLLSTS